MADRMQKYVTIVARMPPKRPAGERRLDHREIYPGFTPPEAAIQASRCEQCGVPYCQFYCPLHNDIPGWLKLTAEGRLREAYDLAQSTNNFPEICGRICPQDKLCEAKWACTLEQSEHGAVTIGAVERFITETAWEERWVEPRRPLNERGQRVAIVGAGPAGMAASEELRAAGFQVDLFDREPRMGGLLRYGIPGFKLEKSVVDRREALLISAGVRFTGGLELGRDFSLEGLRSEFDAIVLTVGAQRPRSLDVPGGSLRGVHNALDYLKDSCQLQADPHFQSERRASGARVVVIGGGDTAMDCVRTAVRQGAASVTCLYRRDRASMPGSSREVANAEEEGAAFDWLALPESLGGAPVAVEPGDLEAIDGDGRVSSVRAVRTRALRSADRSVLPEPVPGSSFEIPADLVINALGFQVESMESLRADRLATRPTGAVEVRRPGMTTSLAGVFAAGDIARGPSLVVWAIREGRDAANGVINFLSESDAPSRQISRP